jgi:hypothetical protein
MLSMYISLYHVRLDFQILKNWPSTNTVSKVTWHNEIHIQSKQFMGQVLHYLYSLHAVVYTLENRINIET